MTATTTDDDLFSAATAQRAPIAYITCRVCDRPDAVQLGTVALLCAECRSDLVQTRQCIETARRAAQERLEQSITQFEAKCAEENADDQARYTRVQQERANAVSNGAYLAKVNAAYLRARSRDDGLGRILRAESMLWIVTEEVNRVLEWAQVALDECNAAEADHGQ